MRLTEGYPTGVRYAWAYEKDGRTVEYQPTGPFASDDHELIVEAALAGVGLGFVWEDRAAREITAGRLIRCLESCCAPEGWL